MHRVDKNSFRKVIPILIMILSASVVVVFTVLCMSKFKKGFLYEHATVITSVAVCIEIIYVALTAVFCVRKSETVFKLLLTGLVLFAVILLGLFIFQITGFFDNIYLAIFDKLIDEGCSEPCIIDSDVALFLCAFSLSLKSAGD